MEVIQAISIIFGVTFLIGLVGTIVFLYMKVVNSLEVAEDNRKSIEELSNKIRRENANLLNRVERLENSTERLASTVKECSNTVYEYKDTMEKLNASAAKVKKLTRFPRLVREGARANGLD
jgi:uncharacterized protein YlxW (UPF0749 family)